MRSLEACSTLDLSMHTINNTRGKGSFEGLLSREGISFLVLCGVGIVGAKDGWS